MSTQTTQNSLIRAALLPGVWPRTRELFSSGFPHLAYLMANLFDMLRLLPAEHPYLNRGNFGRYSMLDVLRAGARALKPGWRNTDKFIAFFAVLTGIIMLVVQFILMIAAIIIAPASAQEIPTTYGGFFRTPEPKEDIAFRMLDLVFGIPGLFGLEAGSSKPFHLALQAMLEFYSYGILFIGLLLLIYIVIVIVAETAQSGVPFGKRFKHEWAPLRLVLFLGLLIPINHGINGAQYIVFMSAKAGSGLATNGWILFNERLTGSYLGEREALVAVPATPDLSSVPAFIMIAKACQIASKQEYGRDVQAWVLVDNIAEPLGDSSFQDWTERAGGNGIKIRFGEQNPSYTDQQGLVFPVCGEMFLYTSDMSEPGAAVIQTAYYDLVKILWEAGAWNSDDNEYASIRAVGNSLRAWAGYYHMRDVQNRNVAGIPMNPEQHRAAWGLHIDHLMDGRAVDKAWGDDEVYYQQRDDGGVIGRAVTKQAEEGDWDVAPEVIKKGWAGAAIWYNEIARQNGAIVTAVRNIPTPTLYPDIMVRVAQQRASSGFFSTDEDRFNPASRDPENPMIFADDIEPTLAYMYNNVYLFWQTDYTRTDVTAAHRQPTANIMIDAINLLFGTQGLFEMCRNVDVHPMAQLAALGKGLVDSAIRGFATSAILGVGSGFLSLLSPHLGQAGYAATSLMMTIAGLGLMLGFVLFYLIPFMPFLYFFFAAGAWLKGLFEAIVGAPLWALGHLRIDGEGMSGEAAKDGYFMVLEIFLRPILIIFGLLASMIIFSAMVKVLHQIFGQVLNSLPAGAENPVSCFNDTSAGYSNIRGPIDELFYTIVYAIVVYLIAISSFKLIDGIPKSIMRWIGEEVAAFGDQAGDAADGLIQQVSIGGAAMGGRLEQGIGGVAQNMQQGFGGLIDAVKKIV